MFDRSNNTGTIAVKMDGSVLEEKPYFEMLGLPFCSKFERGSYIVFITKTTSKKIGALKLFMKFVSPCISINLPYGLAWKSVSMSGKKRK